MSHFVFGVEFTAEALAELRTLKPGHDRWEHYARSIAALLTHNADMHRNQMDVVPPSWPRLKLTKWPPRKLWVTEIGGCKVANEMTDHIVVHTIWENDL